MPFIRSISGLRATVSDFLTEKIVADYSMAFATIQPDGPIVIGHDGRPSGAWIMRRLHHSLELSGRSVVNAGMVPTPTVQLLVEKSEAAGGIVVTASHNPAEWNGLKFLDVNGTFLDASSNQKLWNVVDAIPINAHPVELHDEAQDNPLGTVNQQHVDAIEMHVASVLNILPKHFVAAQQTTTSPRQRVVVDAVNSSGSVIVPELLKRLGFEVVELYCDGSGVFPHTPEPITENLTELATAVVTHNACMGVAVDPDADRLVLINEHGQPIGEECTVALAALAVFELGGKGPAVVNYSTSRMTDVVASKFGFPTHRSAVGEINVVRKMQEVHAVVGGEGSGGVILPACHSGRDSLVGLALISWLMLRNEVFTQLSELRAILPTLFMVKNKFELTNRADIGPILKECEIGFSDAELSVVDGLHAMWPDRWIHIRASNTEPIMRVIAEAETEADATALIEKVQAMLRG